MTDKSDVVGRLRARADEQERNNSYPVDRALDREAADEIDRLTAALASERERADAMGALYDGCAQARDEAGILGTVPEAIRYLRDEADALHARVKALEEALRPFSELAGELFARNCNRGDVVVSFDKPSELHRLTFDDFLSARSVLKETKDG